MTPKSLEKSNPPKEILQIDIDNLVNWSDTWLLKFQPDKCKVMSIGHKGIVDDSEPYKMGAHKLDYSENEKDLGVYIDNKLTFESHINNAVNKANRIMAISRKTYDYMDTKTFSYIFKGLVRPHLEYAAPVWSPHTIKLKEIIENVQRRSTKTIPGLSEHSYPDRLKKTKTANPSVPTPEGRHDPSL